MYRPRQSSRGPSSPCPDSQFSNMKGLPSDHVHSPSSVWALVPPSHIKLVQVDESSKLERKLFSDTEVDEARSAEGSSSLQAALAESQLMVDSL